MSVCVCMLHTCATCKSQAFTASHIDRDYDSEQSIPKPNTPQSSKLESQS